MSALSYSAQGKLLLTSEYFVLDGAKALALPTKLGQKIKITPSNYVSSQPTLYWKSFDVNEQLWLEFSFNFSNFEINQAVNQDYKILQRVLRQARNLNDDFLKSDSDIYVETYLDFSREWGLGSSSTLVYLIAQWVSICPFELLQNTLGGSGYDVACAGAKGPILYHRNEDKPEWHNINFNLPFKNQLYFVYLNKKQNTRESIKRYKSFEGDRGNSISDIEKIVNSIINVQSIEEFEKLIDAHEAIVAQYLDLSPVKEQYFYDYWGSIKSLGAWGGDFVLVTSHKDEKETFAYFDQKGYKTIFKYNDLILDNAVDAS